MIPGASESPAVRLARRFLPLGVVLLSLCLYVPTLAPDLLWGGGDFATFQTRAALGEFVAEGGVFDHPLWVILTHPLVQMPLRTPAWRANLASALYASVALALIYLANVDLTGAPISSLLAVGALTVSHTFWTYAVMPKVYSLNALLLAACLYLLLRWRASDQDVWLYLALGLYGLSFLNHLVMATFAPGIALYVGRVMRNRDLRRKLTPILGGTLAFTVGLAPYLYMAAAAGRTSDTGGSLLAFATGLAYTLTHPQALARGLAWGVLLGVYQFPLSFPLGLFGLVLLWRHDRAAVLLLCGGILGALVFMLAAADPSAGGVYVWNLHYYLQGYVPFAPAIAVGLAKLWNVRMGRTVWIRLALVFALLATPALGYLAAPSLARAIMPQVPDFRPLPGRDNFRYVLAPWKQAERGARPFGEAVLRALPQGATLFADYSIWAVVRYLQAVEGQRPDVSLVRLRGVEDQVATIAAHDTGRPLYLADTYRYYDVDGISSRYLLEPVGPIWRMIPR